ncbi:MAG: hypothetical protein AAFW98_10805, partial [Pseudomonadota bacterium]
MKHATTLFAAASLLALAAAPATADDWFPYEVEAWDPPFDMDMSLIRDKDEDFWDEYRTSPKMFVSHEAGKNMWDSRFGYYT